MSEARKLPTIPLTTSVEGLMAKRKRPHIGSLNDEAEQLYLVKIQDPEFQQFVSAAWDEEAVEGSMYADDLEAASLMRDYARENGGFPLAARANKEAIGHSLRVVLNRYEESRKARRARVGGVVVDPTDKNNSMDSSNDSVE